MDRLYLQQLQAEADGAAAGSAAIVAEQKQGIAEQVSKQQSAIDGLKDIIR